MSQPPDLLSDEHADLAAFLRSLTPEQWDRPSLCDGWTTRDVVAHLAAWDDLLIYTSAEEHARRLLGLSARFVRSGLSMNRLNAQLHANAGGRSPAEILIAFERRGADGPTRVFDRAAPGAQLAEYLVHHQDIRRALPVPRTIPAERLICALDAVGKVPGVRAARRTRGLRLRATDLDWSAGHGAEVRGPGEALLMALAGRPSALDDLAGEGTDILTRRMRTTGG